MQHSESIKELAAALLKAQQSFETATKGADNPFFKSKYADLPEVWRVAKGPLGANGLAIVQSPESDGNGAIEIETMLVHAPSGEWIKSRMRMKPVKDDPQGVGSCITYARRYALSALIGIVADEDDDGNAASHAAPPAAKKEATKQPATAKVVDIARGMYLSFQETGMKKDEIMALFQKVTGKSDMKALTQPDIDKLKAALEMRRIEKAALDEGGGEVVLRKEHAPDGVEEIAFPE